MSLTCCLSCCLSRQTVRGWQSCATECCVPGWQSYVKAYYAPGWQNCAGVCCAPGWLCSVTGSSVVPGLSYFSKAAALEAYSWADLFRCAKAGCFLFVKAAVQPALFALAGVVQPARPKALLW